MEYDLLNREIRRIEKDGGVQRTVYDRNGQVVRLIRPTSMMLNSGMTSFTPGAVMAFSSLELKNRGDIIKI